MAVSEINSRYTDGNENITYDINMSGVHRSNRLCIRVIVSNTDVSKTNETLYERSRKDQRQRMCWL